MTRANSYLRIYGLATTLTIFLLGWVILRGNTADLVSVLILAGLEITFSFDNAVVNAKVLQKLSPIWQQIFMTVGIAIAVFGVRILLPLLMVGFTTGTRISEVLSLALHHPEQYAEKLLLAHPYIAGFGSMFLLMIFLDFMFQEREIKWLHRLETLLAKAGQLETLSILIASLVLVFATFQLATEHDQAKVFVSGIVGLVVYLAIKLLDKMVSEDSVSKKVVATSFKAGLIGFLYLELIDASFSLDGVIGAFAITNKIVLIAAGLGIGALYVRAMTVHLLRRGTLSKYRYMEHGAHYAIGILSLNMLLSLKFDIPDAITGLSGILVIIIAVVHSHIETVRDKKPAFPQ
jgi:hypothetical protein